MTKQSAPIDFFKKQAKALLKAYEANESKAIQRIRSSMRDTDDFTLMKAQHVIAQASGFAKWQDLAAASEMELRLAITMLKVPELTDFGIGVYDQRRLSHEERELKFTKEREDLRRNAQMVSKTVEWLKANVAPIQTISTERTSYGLKHIAERNMDTYITNGAFIAAAIMAGYPYKLKPGSPNVHFAMSEKSLKALSRQ